MDAEGNAVQFEDGSQPGMSCIEEQSADPDTDLAKERQEVAVWLPQLPGERTIRYKNKPLSTRQKLANQ
ncbi:hypothetical protein W03_03340 [Nitrosomonas sp. PY1]|uniref:hypothetical protein n=1 Tax=Nitrosomonas sp. PY1 TaxID=1803906 RepID=UPI001FC87F4D|nr:hypothetical protein [Nitrosomonas sp. PY1]GKS68330.1 hypothetical protein W03_03340 [Nitrosomonas sp. PY1]